MLNYAAGPPLRVPLPFFLLAPWLAALAMAALAWSGPEALAHRWQPALLGAVHLLAVGFLLPVMVGALFQLLPVLSGRRLPGTGWAAPLLQAALPAGALCLWLGFLSGSPVLFRLAVMVLGLGVGGFALLLALSLLRAGNRGATLGGMRYAALGLAVTLALGLALGAAYGWPGSSLPRQWTDAHAAWGLLGWVAALVMAVAFQVLPMFHVTGDYPPWFTRLAPPALSLGLALWVTLRATGTSGWLPLAALLPVLAAGLGFAAVSVRRLWRRRRRGDDPGVAYWYLALAALVTGLGMAAAGAGLPALRGPTLDLLVGACLLLGFGATVVVGMLQKIVAFLLWLHLQQASLDNRIALRRLPGLYDVIPRAATRRQLRLHALGLAALGTGLLWPPLLRPGFILLAAGFGWLGWTLATAIRFYLRTRAELLALPVMPRVHDHAPSGGSP